MRVAVVSEFGKELTYISAEGRAGLPADQAIRDLGERFDAELRGRGLSLANTIRSRLWGRDREARDLGSKERVAVLSGSARSASSSFIAPSYFDSEAAVALDLVALRPSNPSAQKTLREYEPAIVPLRYLVYDGLAVLSGVTCEEGDLDVQLDNILPRIGESLSAAGTSWDRVVRFSGFLHRSQKIEDLRSLLSKHLGSRLPAAMEVSFADGYSSLGKLIEIEVTATV
jgi:enamine deaminase RidA (YjgF/YER057c/UK114 family)